MGEFVLRKPVAQGGFATVYSPSTSRWEREAVVKVLHGKLRRGDVGVQRFLREVRLACLLDHPYAAQLVVSRNHVAERWTGGDGASE